MGFISLVYIVRVPSAVSGLLRLPQTLGLLLPVTTPELQRMPHDLSAQYAFAISLTILSVVTLFVYLRTQHRRSFAMFMLVGVTLLFTESVQGVAEAAEIKEGILGPSGGLMGLSYASGVVSSWGFFERRIVRMYTERLAQNQAQISKLEIRVQELEEDRVAILRRRTDPPRHP